MHHQQMMGEFTHTFHVYDSAFCNGNDVAYVVMAESKEEAQELYIDLVEEHGGVTGNLCFVCH